LIKESLHKESLVTTSGEIENHIAQASKMIQEINLINNIQEMDSSNCHPVCEFKSNKYTDRHECKSFSDSPKLAEISEA